MKTTMKTRKSIFTTLLLVWTGIAATAYAAEPSTTRTAELARFESLRYGMFVEFGMPPFAGEWSFGKAMKKTLPESKIYAPPSIDADQWLATAKAAGMKYAVLTAKHNVGHCLWDSAFTDYDVATSGNPTDVVAEYVAACRRHGIEPGLYYNLGKDIAHRRDKKMSDDEYADFAMNQISELLTNYGPIYLIWLDGGANVSPAVHQRAYDTVKSIQPDCLVVLNQSHTDGQIVARWPTDVVTGERTLPPLEGHQPQKVHENKNYYLPMEVCTTTAAGWFWQAGEKPRKLAKLLQVYSDATGRGANLLLGANVDLTGRIPQETVDRLLELGKSIKSIKAEEKAL